MMEELHKYDIDSTKYIWGKLDIREKDTVYAGKCYCQTLLFQLGFTKCDSSRHFSIRRLKGKLCHKVTLLSELETILKINPIKCNFARLTVVYHDQAVGQRQVHPVSVN